MFSFGCPPLGEMVNSFLVMEEWAILDMWPFIWLYSINVSEKWAVNMTAVTVKASFPHSSCVSQLFLSSFRTTPERFGVPFPVCTSLSFALAASTQATWSVLTRNQKPRKKGRLGERNHWENVEMPGGSHRVVSRTGQAACTSAMTCLIVLALQDLKAAQAMWMALSPPNHVIWAHGSLLPGNNQLPEPASSLNGIYAQIRRLPTYATGGHTGWTVGKPRSRPQPNTYRSHWRHIWCCSTPARWVAKLWVPTASLFKTNCKGHSESRNQTLPTLLITISFLCSQIHQNKLQMTFLWEEPNSLCSLWQNGRTPVAQTLRVTRAWRKQATHAHSERQAWRDAGRAQPVGQWPHRKASEQHVQGQSPSHSLPLDVRATGREKMTLLAARGLLDTISHQDRALGNTWGVSWELLQRRVGLLHERKIAHTQAENNVISALVIRCGYTRNSHWPLLKQRKANYMQGIAEGTGMQDQRSK